MWLIHHGRKGQHWGELNGPPYPLDMTNKEYKKAQSEPEKTHAEKHFPKLVEMTNKQLDFIEKYLPTQYKAMELEAKMYKKMLPKMYELDKKLGYGIVVRNGKPISLKRLQTENIMRANQRHNQMFYGHP